MPGSRNAIPVSRSRLSISLEDVPFTGVIGVGLPAGARMGGVIAGWSLTPLPGPHLRLQTIDTAGGGAPETSQNGRGEGTGERE